MTHCQMAYSKTFEKPTLNSALKISLVVIPTFAAAEEDAPLVECAENMAVSIPAALETDQQEATELDVTALCGLMKEINSLVLSPQIGLVLFS